MYVSLLRMEGLLGGSENLPYVMPAMPGQSLTIPMHDSSEHQDSLTGTLLIKWLTPSISSSCEAALSTRQ